MPAATRHGLTRALVLLVLLVLCDASTTHPARASSGRVGRGHELYVPMQVHVAGTRETIARSADPVRFSVPVPRSAEIESTAGITVANVEAYQVRVAAWWPPAPSAPADAPRHVQWLAVEALCDHDGKAPTTVIVATGGEAAPAPSLVTESADGIRVRTASGSVTLEAGPRVVAGLGAGETEWLDRSRNAPFVELVGEDGRSLTIEPASCDLRVLDAGPVAARVLWTGSATRGDERLAIELVLSFWSDRDGFEVACVLRGEDDAPAPALTAARLALPLARRGAIVLTPETDPEPVHAKARLTQGRPRATPLPGPGAPAESFVGWRTTIDGETVAAEATLLRRFALALVTDDGAWAAVATRDAEERDHVALEAADGTLSASLLTPRAAAVRLEVGREVHSRHLFAVGGADEDVIARAEAFARPLVARPLDPQALNAADVLGDVVIGDAVTRVWHAKKRLPPPQRRGDGSAPSAYDAATAEPELLLWYELLEAEAHEIGPLREQAEKATRALLWGLKRTDARDEEALARWLPAVRLGARLDDDVVLQRAWQRRWGRSATAALSESSSAPGARRASADAALAAERAALRALLVLELGADADVPDPIAALAETPPAADVDAATLARRLRALARLRRLAVDPNDAVLLDAIERDARRVLDELWLPGEGFRARADAQEGGVTVSGPELAFPLGWLVTGDPAFLHAGTALLELAAARTGEAVPSRPTLERQEILHLEQFGPLYDVWRPLPLRVERDDEGVRLSWTVPARATALRLKTAAGPIGEAIPFHAAEEIAPLVAPGTEGGVQSLRLEGLPSGDERSYSLRFLDRPPSQRHERAAGPDVATLVRHDDGRWELVDSARGAAPRAAADEEAIAETLREEPPLLGTLLAVAAVCVLATAVLAWRRHRRRRRS